MSTLLSRADAARYLGVTLRTVDRYRESGRLHTHYAAGRSYVDLDASDPGLVRIIQHYADTQASA